MDRDGLGLIEGSNEGFFQVGRLVALVVWACALEDPARQYGFAAWTIRRRRH